ncbi:hypothetical protein [Streptomyces sp. DT203]|uniref:hypothetical protein n=1 Tax=Streptomyces sp. DT203 TaxID=3393424 RepID=UPI003CF7EAE2
MTYGDRDSLGLFQQRPSQGWGTASDALPGAVHDLTAARTHGIPATLAADDIKRWADKA